MSGNKIQAGRRHGRLGGGSTTAGRGGATAGSGSTTGGQGTADRLHQAGWPPQLTAAVVRELPRPPALGGAIPAQEPTAAFGARREGAAPGGSLPGASQVLAVVARPGQESSELGAVLAAFGLQGAQLAVLCLTRGEASEVNSTCERLELLRPWELREAAGMLGVSSVTVADYPDGRLGYLPPAGLAEHIGRAARRVGADLLLVVDPAAVADLDTAAVARAASMAGHAGGLPVLARTVAGPGRRWRLELGPAETGVRARQRRAMSAHRSQHEEWRAAGAAAAVDGEAPPAAVPELIRWLVAPLQSAPSEAVTSHT